MYTIKRGGNKKNKTKRHINCFANVKHKYGVLSYVTKIFSNNKVSIKRVLQNPYKNKKKSSIVIITHRSKDNDIQKTLKTLAKKSYIIHKPKLLRIENG